MKLQIGNILKALLGLSVVIVVVGGFVLLIIKAPIVKEEAIREATFIQYQESANVFKSRMTDYDGLCQELLLTKDTRCMSTADTYLVAVKIKDGAYYCTDATNFLGTVTVAPNGMTCW
jgi:hypothetical protein